MVPMIQIHAEGWIRLKRVVIVIIIFGPLSGVDVKPQISANWTPPTLRTEEAIQPGIMMMEKMDESFITEIIITNIRRPWNPDLVLEEDIKAITIHQGRVTKFMTAIKI